jgi:hypothetical protein
MCTFQLSWQLKEGESQCLNVRLPAHHVSAIFPETSEHVSIILQQQWNTSEQVAEILRLVESFSSLPTKIQNLEVLAQGKVWGCAFTPTQDKLTFDR